MIGYNKQFIVFNLLYVFKYFQALFFIIRYLYIIKMISLCSTIKHLLRNSLFFLFTRNLPDKWHMWLVHVIIITIITPMGLYHWPWLNILIMITQTIIYPFYHQFSDTIPFYQYHIYFSMVLWLASTATEDHCRIPVAWHI